MRHALHAWDLTPEQAIALQRQLAAHIVFDRPLPLECVKYVAGVDVSVRMNEKGEATSQAAVAVLSFPKLEVIQTTTARMITPFPYIPGLLSFREGPVLLQAIDKLERQPDVFLFDGMGRAHPRRLGIASHIGLWLSLPTIGCGKTRLVGQHDEPANARGAHAPLIDKGEVIGVALRTRASVKPVYLSPGHLIDLSSAIALTLACTTRYRLPEPIRAAHKAAGDLSSLEQPDDPASA
ncbi:MAG: deoxyribonuclease V [Aggregatilineales bacterium]